MNKYNLISLNALLILVVVLPIYARLEPIRMERARSNWQQQLLVDGSAVYLENCAMCHGANGEGIATMPALNHPGLVHADAVKIHDIIAHSPHGTSMAAWHLDEGGNLNNYQVDGLVTLIKQADWSQVERLAVINNFTPPPVDIEQFATLEGEGEASPHECRACHEEPEVHADRFGLNCSRCHSLTAWKPALLSRHTFTLDHGGLGEVACQTCHITTYASHTCYGCHDHEPAQIQQTHQAEGIPEFEACIECHPTGAPGEADRYLNSRAILSRN
jgi:hypothetical protein